MISCLEAKMVYNSGVLNRITEPRREGHNSSTIELLNAGYKNYFIPLNFIRRVSTKRFNKKENELVRMMGQSSRIKP